MTAPPTPERLAEVRARAEAATVGPWEWDAPSTEPWPSGDENLHNAANDPVLSSWGYDADGIDASAEDRAFIAHARTDVPDLLAALDAATERAEKAEAALARVEAALSAHPECDRYAEDDVITCGWKRAVHSVREAMEGKP